MKKILAYSLSLLAFIALVGWLSFGYGQFFQAVAEKPKPVVSVLKFDQFNRLLSSKAARGVIEIKSDGKVQFEGTLPLGVKAKPTTGVFQLENFSQNVSQAWLTYYQKRHIAVAGEVAVTVAERYPGKAQIAVSLLSGSMWNTLAGLLTSVLMGVLLLMVLKNMRGSGPSLFGKRYTAVVGTTITFSQVAGLSGPKAEVQEVVQYLRDPQAFAQVGAKGPRGILLVGSPGNGKTLLAKACAGESGVAFLEQNASSFVQLFAGAGAMSVRQLFAEARKRAPCIVFIDEIDAVGGSRFSGSMGNDERLQTLNALLAELDGFGDNTGILVIAATNQADVLDPALLRPGRFDRKVFVPMPGNTDRQEILSYYLAKTPSELINVSHLAKQAQGFSGADLANWVNEAAVEAARAKATAITMDHFQSSRDRILLGPRNHGILLSDKDREVTAWHEAGHAVARIATGGKVDKVSILPRGMAMGVTISLPGEETVFHTEARLYSELVVLMGGRAAEELFVGEISAGAASDMARASDVARAGVMQYGFSPMGPFVPKGEVMVSEAEAYAAKWVRDAYAEAKTLLLANRSATEELKDRLLAEDEVSY